jgi:hypothetical protein
MSSTSDITTGSITADALVTCNYGLDVTGTASADSMETGTLYVDGVELDANAVKSFGTATESSGQISIPYYTFASGNRQAGTINFNIAATQFYIDAVAAAEANGIAIGESHFTLASVTLQGASHTVTPISGGGWYCHAGSTYTVQGTLIRIALYDADGVRYNTNGVNVYKEGTSTVQAASGSYYRYSAGDPLYLYDGGQTYTNTYYTKTS